MSLNLTIGKISKQVGLPVKTIRFYEDVGIISKPSRLENGYRVYDDSTMDLLKLIKYARDLGLPLKEIKKLIIGCEDGDCAHSKDYIYKEIDNYLNLLSEKEKQMLLLKNRLVTMKRILKEDNFLKDKNSKYCCNIFGQLTEIAKGGEEK